MTVIDERPKSPIEKRKRNLIFFSPISRRERETWNSFPQFREEKEKFEKRFSIFEKRKRKGFSFLKFREEKENFVNKSPISRREREIWNVCLYSFPSTELRSKENYTNTHCAMCLWQPVLLKSGLLPAQPPPLPVKASCPASSWNSPHLHSLSYRSTSPTLFRQYFGFFLVIVSYRIVFS